MKKFIFLLAFLCLNQILFSQKISSDFPFQSHFQKVGNDRIHYIDEGKGDPILFLHGVPMSSYSWRNIIPHLSKTNRCIAIDFMGFGKSDKPDIDYSFEDQLKYLSAFIDSLQLENITLVMTDLGGIIGLNYALNHEGKIKNLVLMETPIGDARTFHKNGGMMQKMMFWMARKEKRANRMFVKKNMFLKMMPRLIKRKLTKEEKENYQAPFKIKASRKALVAPPHSFPKKGKNAKPNDMGDFMNKNAEWLKTTKLPKLLLHAKPGMLVNKKALKWANKNLSNLETKKLGKAKHLMEEDLPNEIGMAIKDWLLKLD